MTGSASTPAELAVLLARSLTAENIPHAIGGAVAYTFWGVPRATGDLDLNLFVKAERAATALEVLTRNGVSLDVEAALRSGLERGDARGRYGDIPVDIFFLSIPLHESAARRTVEVPLLGSTIRILAAEDLTILKLLFFRTKDILDIERILAVQGAELDRQYVRRWLVECVGEEDARVARWDTLCRALPAPPEKL